MQEFYRIYHKSHSSYAIYREQEAKWEKNYGENAQRQKTRIEYKQLQDYQKETDRQHTERIYHSKDKGARYLASL